MLHKYFPSQFIWEVFFHARISSQPLFHLKNPTMQDFYRSFNRDCELVSQLPIIYERNMIVVPINRKIRGIAGATDNIVGQEIPLRLP